MASQLTMLEVARAASVPRTTVRFYERAGLLPQPTRSRAGYRLFSDDTVVVVRFVKRAQELGFTLEELHSFLALSRGNIPKSLDVVALARHKLEEIDAKIRDLRNVRSAIESRVHAATFDGPCPILASLGGEVPTVCGELLEPAPRVRRRSAKTSEKPLTTRNRSR